MLLLFGLGVLFVWFFACFVGFLFLLFVWVFLKEDSVVKVATRTLLQPQTLFLKKPVAWLCDHLRQGCCLKAAQERGATAWQGSAPALGTTSC